MLLSCYHCGLPVPRDSHYAVVINGEAQPMCCPGCEAVAGAITNLGLQNYYDYRTAVAEQANLLERDLQDELQTYDRTDVQQEFVFTPKPGIAEAIVNVEGITCAACSWLIEHQLQKLPGVLQATVNLSNHRVRVRWATQDIKFSDILAGVYRIGYRARPLLAAARGSHLETENRNYLRRLGVAGVGMAQVMMYSVALYAGAFEDMSDANRNFIRAASLLITTPVALYAALPFYQSAWRNLKLRSLGMDVPVSIAILAAFLASAWSTLTQGQEVYFDSVCMFTFFLLLGRFLEFRARLRIDREHQNHTPLLPQTVNRLQGEQLEVISLRDLGVGDRILVKAGETVPADGTLLDPTGSFDESMVTGEFMPINKAIGDTIIAGSINREQPIQLEVTEVAHNTRVAAILRLLDFAVTSKPPIALLADKVARYFVAFVLIMAALVALYWFRVDSGNAFWITLSVLVVTCPCALSLATPTALTTATTRLHQAGLIIIRGHTLEGLAQATHIIFDKTGTLTKGQLELKDILPVAAPSRHECHNIAAALEAHSEHPIAKAFEHSSLAATDITIHTGSGIEGYIDGTRYRIGRPDFVLEINASKGSGLDLPAAYQTGQWLLLGDASGALAWLQFDDELRDTSVAAVAALKSRGLQVEILSGDYSANVASIARRLGISQYRSACNPEQKLAYIHSLQAQGATVVMVGDGINDVPVIASADVSVAMTGATDLTKAQADAILLSGKLTSLVTALEMADRCRTVIRQNIGWALAYNLAALPLAAMGYIPPYAAAIGMSLSSLVVVCNALRLNKSRGMKPTPPEVITTA